MSVPYYCNSNIRAKGCQGIPCPPNSSEGNSRISRLGIPLFQAASCLYVRPVAPHLLATFTATTRFPFSELMASSSPAIVVADNSCRPIVVIDRAGRWDPVPSNKPSGSTQIVSMVGLVSPSSIEKSALS